MHDVFSNPTVRIYGDKRLLTIGRHVRIDDGCIISIGPAGIAIGDYVHIAAGCYFFGGGGRIMLNDFVGVSSRSVIYTATDDFTDGYLTGPTLPNEYRKVTTGPVHLGRHVVIGCGTVVMPGTRVEDYSTVGAMSLVKGTIPQGQVAFGVPARVHLARNTERLRALEQRLREQEAQSTPAQEDDAAPHSTGGSHERN